MKKILSRLTVRVAAVVLVCLLCAARCENGEPYYGAVMRVSVLANYHEFKYYYGGGNVYRSEVGSGVPFSIVEDDEEFEREPFTKVFYKVVAKIDSVHLVKLVPGQTATGYAIRVDSTVQVWRKTDTFDAQKKHFYNINSWQQKTEPHMRGWYFTVTQEDLGIKEPPL